MVIGNAWDNENERRYTAMEDWAQENAQKQIVKDYHPFLLKGALPCFNMLI
jgi:hypothetical protein